ncbi:hypothetical protein EON63_08015 [archaeon]|nr:MAG: hypothetical protein EON63_08015 [archaeon]
MQSQEQAILGRKFEKIMSLLREIASLVDAVQVMEVCRVYGIWCMVYSELYLVLGVWYGIGCVYALAQHTFIIWLHHFI